MIFRLVQRIRHQVHRCNQSTWSAWTTSSPLGLAPWGSGSCEEGNVKLNIPGLLTQSRLWQLSTNFIRCWCYWATWSASATSSGSGESSLALWGSGACKKKQCERNILGQNPHCSYCFTTVVKSKCNQTTWSMVMLDIILSSRRVITSKTGSVRVRILWRKQCNK